MLVWLEAFAPATLNVYRNILNNVYNAQQIRDAVTSNYMLKFTQKVVDAGLDTTVNMQLLRQMQILESNTLKFADVTIVIYEHEIVVYSEGCSHMCSVLCRAQHKKIILCKESHKRIVTLLSTALSRGELFSGMYTNDKLILNFWKFLRLFYKS